MINIHITFKDKTDITLKDVKDINISYRTHKIIDNGEINFNTTMGIKLDNPYYLHIVYGERSVLINTDLIDVINISTEKPFSVDDIKKYLLEKYGFCEGFAFHVINECNISLDSEEWYLHEQEYKKHIIEVDYYIATHIYGEEA